MKLLRAYRYRIYPTADQLARLGAWQNALRFLWNVALEQYQRAIYARSRVDRRYPTAFGQGVELTALRAELPWLRDVPRHLCASVLGALENAWRRCWDGGGAVGAPCFKSKRRGDLAPMAEFDGAVFRVEGEGRHSAITFPKLGALRAVIHRPLGGKAKSCALSREGDAWFASVTCEVEVPDPTPSTKPMVAIDRGVVNLVADSDRRIVENPRAGERLRARIAKAQRVVARRKRGSKNQQKARQKVAALQRRARRQRDHVLHVESKRYAESKGVIVVEALNVRQMSKSAKGTVEEPGVNVAAKAGLNRAILDSGWSRFVELLRYKVVPEGARVVEVPAAYSSQTCAGCGVVDGSSRRAQDTFLCASCGHFDHADINAAKVLLARGIDALTAEPAVKACGGDAVGRPTKQERGAARRPKHVQGETWSASDA